MIYDVKVLLFLVIAIVAIGQTTEHNLYVDAHYFTPDQSSQFLSLIHQIYVEIVLINETFPSEIGSSYYHSKNAASLMNKTYHLTNAISPVDFQIIYEEE
jgi:hypothetical protein